MPTPPRVVAALLLAGFAAAVARPDAQAPGLRADAAAGAMPPPWAYLVATPTPAGAPAPPPEDPSPKTLAGSSVSLTPAQLRDLFSPPDWHPENHPPPPEVVAHGRKPDVRACGYCHYPNGQGRPENSALVGLPAVYLAQQMADMRAGLRASADPNMRPPAAMLAIAKAATPEEDRAAADYFASFAYKKWVRVVETATVPKNRIAGGTFVPITGAGTEPIAGRILEMPEDVPRADVRDSSIGFVAYVPPGSVKRGEVLVTTGGNGRTMACGTCHGADLKGLGPVPPLAGRSPSYAVRQLFDLQHGVRRGPWAPLMKAAVAKLTLDDMVAIAAYAASREP